MKGGTHMNQVNGQNTDYDKEEYLKKIMDYYNNPTPEMIAQAGGLENYNKILKKWKRDQNLLGIKNTFKFNLKYYFGWIPKFIVRILYILLVIYLIMYFFF